MSDFAISDIAPVYEALGAAVFETQHLERGLYLLLHLMGEKAGQLNAETPPPLDRADAPQTIGQLFREVRMREYLTEAEKSVVKDGVRERNTLIHAYWMEKRALALLTPAGRSWLIKDLNRIRDVCRRAGRIIDSIIDMYLKEHGESLHSLSNGLWENWQSGEEPPPDVLH